MTSTDNATTGETFSSLFGQGPANDTISNTTSAFNSDSGVFTPVVTTIPATTTIAASATPAPATTTSPGFLSSLFNTINPFSSSDIVGYLTGTAMDGTVQSTDTSGQPSGVLGNTTTGMLGGLNETVQNVGNTALILMICAVVLVAIWFLFPFLEGVREK